MNASDIAGMHTPVLLERCLDLLGPALTGEAPVLVDATLGMGGHTEAALDRFPELRVIGIDRDDAALALAGERLHRFGSRFVGVKARYDEILDVLSDQDRSSADGVLMDLGVSSLQLDDTSRGFSYAQDAPLDMRMDATGELTAEAIVNEYSAAELSSILRRYGEERFASRIAAAIIRRRAERPLTRSAELVEIIRDAIPAPAKRTGGNPAKRTFQALRIEVNSELSVLDHAVPAAIEALPVGGRIVVMAYQSLEDRIVKNALSRGTRSSAPPDLPIEPESHRPYLRMLTRGAEEAPPDEQRDNPRSRSVRLRAAERLRPTPDHLTDYSPPKRRAASTDRRRTT